METKEKIHKATKEQIARLRKAHDEISDVQIELLRAEDGGAGKIDWETLWSLRGDLNRWIYFHEKDLA